MWDHTKANTDALCAPPAFSETMRITVLSVGTASEQSPLCSPPAKPPESSGNERERERRSVWLELLTHFQKVLISAYCRNYYITLFFYPTFNIFAKKTWTSHRKQIVQRCTNNVVEFKLNLNIVSVQLKQCYVAVCFKNIENTINCNFYEPSCDLI